MESLSDIVAQMRGRGEDGRVDRHLWNEYADRIEAAAKRVVVSKTETVTVGNAAAMREALEYVLHFDATDETAMEDGLTDAERIAEYADHIEECQKKANAALSAPARNCDLYNDVEDSWQDYKQFRRQTGEDVYFDMVHFWPFAKWLLAPAAERKGEN